jgi:hypothetical protein
MSSSGLDSPSYDTPLVRADMIQFGSLGNPSPLEDRGSLESSGPLSQDALHRWLHAHCALVELKSLGQVVRRLGRGLGIGNPNRAILDYLVSELLLNVNAWRGLVCS